MLRTRRKSESGIYVAAFALFAALELSGCDPSRLNPKIALPKGSFDVKMARPSSNQYSLSFEVKATNDSYLAFQGIKQQLVNQNLRECTKSAIESWQAVPGDASGKKWLVEMFSKPDRTEFVLLRVDQGFNQVKGTVTQSVSVVYQRVNLPNESNIREFCG